MLACAACLRAQEPKLAIERALLHTSEDGAPAGSDYEFLPGDMVYFSCQLAGYKKAEKDYDRFEIYLTYSVEARDAHDVLLVPPEADKIATGVATEDKDWMPKIRFSFVIPSSADSGQYKISVKAKDEYGHTEAQSVTPFTVKARDVAPSDTLLVRNFHFYRGEEDEHPLQVAAYQPGDTLWARFDMTGYKLGEKNRFDVEYGLDILRPGGEVAYSQPHAAGQKNESFYPQRHTPGVLSLNIPKDMALGQYTIVLTVRDNIGEQTYEVREKFSIE